MQKTENAKITRADYPELDRILWDIHATTISRKHAFEIYERRWRYVEHLNLTEKESKLIAELTQEFGNGVFLSH